MSTAALYWMLPLLPLAGSGLNGIFGSKFPRALNATIALLSTAASFALAIYLCVTMPAASLDLPGPAWIRIANFTANFNLFADHLTVVMLMVVTGVGFLIHIYSAAYMAHEEGYWRFFSYLNLFMFFMLVLVLAGNFLLMFVGWEGVGLASYLLIGFYYTRDSASAAGLKAFVVNRIGDFGFLIAIFLLIEHFGSLNYSSVFGAINAAPNALSPAVYTAIALLMLLGATGKSAQIPLYVWLPDAMEGPTPVSALIHAATMVTAGVYMIARSHIIFQQSPVALSVVAIIGAATAFFAATIGMVQTDIKRVLAYSTISQLGYMFLACGVAAYSAGIFHLVTHAFFKALLFLAAGSVIHALNGEQDMRNMGGLRRRIPVTFWTMTAATLAITGIFPFAGFFSKDEILYQAFSGHGTCGKILWAVGLLTAFLTAFYMFRLWYLTFFGERRTAATHDAHEPHESPWLMLAPLCILALLSLTGGWIGWPQALGGSNWFGNFLAPVFSDIAHPREAANAVGNTERILAVISLATAALGWFIADLMYRRKPQLAAAAAQKWHALYSLLAHKYWIDDLYSATIVRPLTAFSRVVLWRGVDEGVIDGISAGTAESAASSSRLVGRIQSGNIRSYAGWILAGAACILLIALLMGRGFAASWLRGVR
jgi:NADH-quinone oxidoreductase subunit L